jgi:hypothetical protein
MEDAQGTVPYVLTTLAMTGARASMSRDGTMK